MYNLELDKTLDLIQKNKAKKVLLQLPDGLKTKSKDIVDFLKKSTKASIFVWQGTCFGSCDTIDTDQFDIIISYGHSRWN